MSLIKLASMPIVVINNKQDSSGSSKTFSGKNTAAMAVGGTTGFALADAIEFGHLPGKLSKFDKTKISHRYARRMGSVAGGFAGAAGLYSLLNKKKEDQKPQFYML